MDAAERPRAAGLRCAHWRPDSAPGLRAEEAMQARRFPETLPSSLEREFRGQSLFYRGESRQEESTRDFQGSSAGRWNSEWGMLPWELLQEAV